MEGSPFDRGGPCEGRRSMAALELSSFLPHKVNSKVYYGREKKWNRRRRKFDSSTQNTTTENEFSPPSPFFFSNFSHQKFGQPLTPPPFHPVLSFCLFFSFSKFARGLCPSNPPPLLSACPIKYVSFLESNRAFV